MTPIGPIAPEERINSLDALRGFALLGILPAKAPARNIPKRGCLGGAT